MGLGKTLQTIAFLSALLRKSKEDFRTRAKGIDPVLIVAPASVCRSPWSLHYLSLAIQVLGNWCKEGEKWGMRHFFEYRGKDRSDGVAVLLLLSFLSAHILLLPVLRRIRDGKGDVLLTSYETFRADIDTLNKASWTCVVFDGTKRIF
jgi:SNF2 family DNA or RNA helicase